MKGTAVSCPIVSEFEAYRSFEPTSSITRLVIPEIPLTLTDYKGEIIVHRRNELDDIDDDSSLAPTVLKEGIELPDELVQMALSEIEAQEENKEIKAQDEYKKAKDERQRKFTEAYRELKRVEFPSDWVDEQIDSGLPTEEEAQETIRKMGYLNSEGTVATQHESRSWWKFW